MGQLFGIPDTLALHERPLLLIGIPVEGNRKTWCS
jgi:hypothetical protein